MTDPANTSNSAHELDAPPWMRFESTLMATSRDIRRAYDQRLGNLGLNLSEACLLCYVNEFGPITQTAVAARLGMGRAAAGFIVDALSAKGWIVRTPNEHDRRVWLLATTPTGDACCDEISSEDARVREELRAGVSRSERQQLSSTLAKIRANLAPMVDAERSD